MPWTLADLLDQYPPNVDVVLSPELEEELGE